ncbi:hypothetical protein K402DRAFT_423447 [Aulographum hederae CBS 113979]|uniref:Uncharacterized protein n=1 Tax=Aulographum hederae CBS 113979 TaxID=1176131 RepID=A0A6G1GSS7_9PEZI|nr:hypothetical protein K402DRAFT_423447 [Aulographum hederae CBS 113979]
MAKSRFTIRPSSKRSATAAGMKRKWENQPTSNLTSPPPHPLDSTSNSTPSKKRRLSTAASTSDGGSRIRSSAWQMVVIGGGASGARAGSESPDPLVGDEDEDIEVAWDEDQGNIIRQERPNARIGTQSAGPAPDFLTGILHPHPSGLDSDTVVPHARPRLPTALIEASASAPASVLMNPDSEFQRRAALILFPYGGCPPPVPATAPAPTLSTPHPNPNPITRGRTTRILLPNGSRQYTVSLPDGGHHVTVIPRHFPGPALAAARAPAPPSTYSDLDTAFARVTTSIIRTGPQTPYAYLEATTNEFRGGETFRYYDHQIREYDMAPPSRPRTEFEISTSALQGPATPFLLSSTRNRAQFEIPPSISGAIPPAEASRAPILSNPSLHTTPLAARAEAASKSPIAMRTSSAQTAAAASLSNNALRTTPPTVPARASASPTSTQTPAASPPPTLSRPASKAPTPSPQPPSKPSQKPSGNRKILRRSFPSSSPVGKIQATRPLSNDRAPPAQKPQPKISGNRTILRRSFPSSSPVRKILAERPLSNDRPLTTSKLRPQPKPKPPSSSAFHRPLRQVSLPGGGLLSRPYPQPPEMRQRWTFGLGVEVGDSESEEDEEEE